MHRIENKDGTVLILHDGKQLKFEREFLENITKHTENDDAMFDYLHMHAIWKRHRTIAKYVPDPCKCVACNEDVSCILMDIIVDSPTYEKLFLCPFCLTELAVDVQNVKQLSVRLAVESDKPCTKTCEPNYEDM